jgi:hypothetical protein
LTTVIGGITSKQSKIVHTKKAPALDTSKVSVKHNAEVVQAVANLALGVLSHAVCFQALK